MSSAMTRYERLASNLKRVKEDLKTGARIGTHAVLATMGGIGSGFLEARFPTIPNTNLPSSAVLGTALVIAAVTNLADEYSDQVGSFGAGLLAAAAGKESEAYFRA